MWKALDFDWWKCDAARAMKQRAIFLRPCLSQQLAVCGLYLVHRWSAQGPRPATAVVAETSSTRHVRASAARRIFGRYLRRRRRGAVREHGGGALGEAARQPAKVEELRFCACEPPHINLSSRCGGRLPHRLSVASTLGRLVASAVALALSFCLVANAGAATPKV